MLNCGSLQVPASSVLVAASCKNALHRHLSHVHEHLALAMLTAMYCCCKGLHTCHRLHTKQVALSFELCQAPKYQMFMLYCRLCVMMGTSRLCLGWKLGLMAFFGTNCCAIMCCQMAGSSASQTNLMGLR